MKNLKKIVCGFFFIALVISGWRYFHVVKYDKQYHDKYMLQFANELVAHNFYEKNKKLKCRVIFPKEEETLDVAECARQISLLSYPKTQKVLAVFSTNFYVLSVHDELYQNTNIREELTAFFEKNADDARRHTLLLVIRRAETYDDIKHVKLVFIN